MKEQKTLRRKIAEKVLMDEVVLLNKKPSELDIVEKMMRKDALSTADAIIKLAKREFCKKQEYAGDKYLGCRM